MFFKLVSPILRLFIWLFYPYKIIGDKKSIPSGKLIVISNHRSNLDVFLIGNLFKDKTYYLCKKEMFKHKILGGLVKALGGVKIDRKKVDLSDIRRCIDLLNTNNRLVIFPEGTRNKTELPLLPTKTGAGMFAVKTKATIVPVYIYKRCKLWHKNILYIGNAFNLENFYDKKFDKDASDEINKRFYNELINCKFELDNLIEAKKIKKIKSK